MLRALAVSFAMLVVNPGPCAAETRAPAVDVCDITVPNGVRTGTCSKLPILQSDSQSDSAAASSTGEDSAAENELLEAVNQSRELAGVPPLRRNESLRVAALAHARRMVESERLEHQFSGEPSLLERIAQVSPMVSPGGSPVVIPKTGALTDVLKIDRAGENIANATCAPGANEVLMRSAPHRRNLLDRGFNVAGVAAIWSRGRLYVVQDFAHEVPSYSAEQTGQLVGRAVAEIRQEAGLPELVQLTPPNLDEAACSLAKENRPNARLLATSYDNRKLIAYTQSRPEILPEGALHLLRGPGVQQFAVGACYARNAAYPTGMYWVAILLY
jgi:uncharacterized protein YkwD